MKNIEKVFYMICGVALVFLGIIIGGLLENNADAQGPLFEPNPEYRVREISPYKKSDIESGINKGCQGGYIFHQMVVTKYHKSNNYDMAHDAMLIFKKK